MEEKEYIDCYSESLQSIIDKYIKTNKYGKFTPILAEIFQRRAYYFNYTDSEMQEQIINFTKNAKSIQLVSSKTFRKKDRAVTVGGYSVRDKAILLNSDSFNNKKKLFDEIGMDETKKARILALEMYNILSHEVYHAISKKGKFLGLQEHGVKDIQRNGVALNEVITEVASTITSFGATEKDFINNAKSTYGYDKITFFTKLLSDAIGVSEKEILKAGMESRRKLQDVIYAQFPEEQHNTVRDMIGAAENVMLTMLFTLEHRTDETGPYINRLKSESYATMAQTMVNLGMLQMSNLPNTTQARKEKIYRLNALRKNIRNIQLENTEIIDERDDSIFESLQMVLANSRDEETALDDNTVENEYEEMIKQEDFLGFKRWDQSVIENKMLPALQENEKNKLRYHVASLLFGAKRIIFDAKNAVFGRLEESFEDFFRHNKFKLFSLILGNQPIPQIDSRYDNNSNEEQKATFDDKYRVSPVKNTGEFSENQNNLHSEVNINNNSERGIDEDL